MVDSMYEAVALKCFLAENWTGNIVEKSGIFVCKTTPFLACCPDGLVSSDGLVEVKCPYVARNYEINPETVPNLFNSADNELKIKDRHIYNYQIKHKNLPVYNTV